MIGLKYHTVSPYIKDKTRLGLLVSHPFNEDLNDEWLMHSLNNFIDTISEPQIYQLHSFMTTRVYPDLTRERVLDSDSKSDILLRDTSRQHMGIEERYNKGLVSIDSIRRIMEPSTKFHWSISRGYERELVDSINKISSENINRRKIKPDISNI